MPFSSRRIRIASWIALILFAPSAAATQIQLEGGRSYTGSSDTAAIFAEAVFNPRRIGDSAFSWAPDVSVGAITGRDMTCYGLSRYGVTDNVYLVAAGARFHYADEGRWYHRLFFSFQPALQTGRTMALSTRYEFVSTLGWQGRSVSVQIRHISNGSTGGPNRGETMALVGVAFGR